MKATLLLIVFSLNTVICFACAIGLDMGFNHQHHHEGDETITRIPSYHPHTSSHQGQRGKDHDKSKDDKGCCNYGLMKFAQVDKLRSQSSNFAVSPVFFKTIVSSYYNILAFPASRATRSIKYFVQSHHPPIPDIRIKVRSFQV